MKLKLIVAILLFIVFSLGNTTDIVAQEYFKSVGLRAGWYNGLSYKAFVTDINSFEVLALATKEGEVSMAAVYQWNFGIGTESGLTWHIGPGLHTNFLAMTDNSYWNLGGNANLGIEYIFPGTNISIGADYNLMVKVYGSGNATTYDVAGVVLRYFWK